jgi:hypothetical protein
MDTAISRAETNAPETGASGTPWHRSRRAILPALLTLLTLSYYLAVLVTRSTNGPLNRLTGAVDLALNLSAGLLALSCLLRFRKVAPTPLRHMTLAIAVSMLFYAIAAICWLVYNFSGTSLPYPGLPDVFYLASYLAWIISVGFLFWALDTNIRDELGPFVDILAVAWTLTIVVLTLLGVSLQTAGDVLKLMLDIVYPFLAALACGLLGALFLGPQLRRMSVSWRWFVSLTYAAWLFFFLSDLGFSITTSIAHGAGTLKYFYFEGGPTDAIGAVGELLLLWAIAFLPLGDSLQPGEESSVPGDFIAGSGRINRLPMR